MGAEDKALWIYRYCQLKINETGKLPSYDEAKTAFYDSLPRDEVGVSGFGHFKELLQNLSDEENQ